MTLSRFLLVFILLGAVFVANGRAGVTVSASIDPAEANVGDEVTVTFTEQGGSVGNIQLPAIDGLTVQGTSTSSQILMNGMSITQNITQSFAVLATRAGDFTIPSLSFNTGNGSIIRTQPLKLHVLAGDATNTPPATQTAPPPSNQGPVVMPSNPAQVTNPPASTGANGSASVPTGADGQPARVFHLITPQTTDAYVGESIPLRIEFFIRAESNAQQNSLPTLIGSDFLMNTLSLRPGQDMVEISGLDYIRDTWITAISAPKAGDFSLEATRDTYWNKNVQGVNDAFSGLFGRQQQLMHQEIGSNKIVIHVHALPDEGKPSDFSGAIGKFQVSGNGTPASVDVGEPVTLHFTVSGEGNFDYVRAPALMPTPTWKSYVATSKISYEDESHTQATKTFDEAIIPLKNGTQPLPPASFSYFDPAAKHYVTVPVTLPSVVVTGVMPVQAAAPLPAATVNAEATASPVPKADQVRPNRLAFGMLSTDLAPAYRHPLFWVIQAGLIALIGAGIVLKFFQPRRDPSFAERALRTASLRQEEDAMGLAAHAGDAVKFFATARHALQLRLAERWQLAPDALTVNEIHQHDPAIAEAVAPLFAEADDVHYSGESRSERDLLDWDRRVREMLVNL